MMIKVIKKTDITKYFAECPICHTQIECESEDLLWSYGCAFYLNCPKCGSKIPQSAFLSKTLTNYHNVSAVQST